MPKLIIKQDLPEPSAQEKLESILRLLLPVLLLLVTAAVALSFYLAREPEKADMAVSSASGASVEMPLVYKRQEERLTAMIHEFDEEEREEIEGSDKHAALVAKANAILQQLSEMNGIVEGLGIAVKDKQALLAQHRYQQDYWESKRIFHNLRLARFDNDAQKPGATNVQSAVAVVPAPVTTEPVEKVVADNREPEPTHTEANPKVDLPADFCPLFGPGAAACKAGATGKDSHE